MKLRNPRDDLARALPAGPPRPAGAHTRPAYSDDKFQSTSNPFCSADSSGRAPRTTCAARGLRLASRGLRLASAARPDRPARTSARARGVAATRADNTGPRHLVDLGQERRFEVAHRGFVLFSCARERLGRHARRVVHELRLNGSLTYRQRPPPRSPRVRAGPDRLRPRRWRRAAQCEGAREACGRSRHVALVFLGSCASHGGSAVCQVV